MTAPAGVPKKNRTWIKYAATAFVAMSIGVVMGEGGGAAPKTATAVPAPTVTVTVAPRQATAKHPVKQKAQPAAAVTHPTHKPVPPAVSKDTVTYVVTGSSAEVTYGPAGSDFNGHVPMTVSKKLGSPSYYAINAQLQGGGTVTCKIEVNGKTISHATASGGYNIASCEITQDLFDSGWQDANG
ncbi:hypothetical protein POF50_027890 [Streptomyces sp. SL13]|uniref:MmpS family membrane protein n=1 Tax=Streptantibioticus silvisoli TaxID=2705255 RepID=A0AA90KBC2_9ACTN|nr:hypothetical protein [Streptantibioticus silvisoli]MDI5964780.1 hypothetical protein [Streptantibioticus silvisoli]MDI5973122.1 hypothetical protein [Streptantibioticus silvisoli]